MNFVYPNFLWALLLLCIPIIIHLFNFRRYKTLYFSKVDLLNEAIENSKSGNQLKHLLILLSRLLAIAALVFAFAQPFIADQENINTETISSIYIDNSFSMQAEGQDGNLLNEVKNKAIDLVKSFEENEKVNLLTTELLSKDQRFYSKSEIIERIKRIDLSPSSTHLGNVLNLQTDLISKTTEQQNKRLFLFSDFQKSTSNLENFEQAEIKTYYYQVKPEVSENLFIDTVWFETPVQSINLPIELHFRIRNNSDKPIGNLNIQLEINSKDKGFKSIEIAANSYVEDKITFSHNTAGTKKGKLNIKTNQLFFDDSFYFTYAIQKETNILIVTESGLLKNSFTQLFDVDSYYNYTTTEINQLKQDDFNGKQLVIFNGINKISSGAKDLLNGTLKNGATVVLIPGKSADLVSWNSYLTSKKQPHLSALKSNETDLSYFNYDDPLYVGVFEKKPNGYSKPKLFSRYGLNISSSNNFITLFGENKSRPFLIYSTLENNGRLFLQTTPLLADFTNFSKQALFAATYLRIAETSAYKKALYYTIGKQESYVLQIEINEKFPIHLINKDNQTDLIPAMVNSNTNRKVVFDHLEGLLNQSGFYTLTNQNEFSDEIAFNYSRDESYISSYDEAEVKTSFNEIGWPNSELLLLNQNGKIEITNIKPKEYWQIFLIFSLNILRD